MRIALITTDDRENFAEYGRPVPYFGSAPQALLEGLAAFPEVEVHVLSCAGRSLPSPEKLGPNIWFHSLLVPRFGWLRTGYQGCVRACRRRLRIIEPEIVHGQGTERDCALAAVFSGRPNLVTIHGNMRDLARLHKARFPAYLWLAARLESFTLGRTGGVICNSRFTESMVRDRAPRVWRVPNAVDLAYFAPLAPPALSPRPVLLNVGAIQPNKQQCELLEAARSWRARGLDFDLRFIGRNAPATPYGARFLQRIEEERAAGWVSYQGIRSTAELVRAFDAATGLIHVSLAESFGLVVAEALCRNLRYFGTTVGGIADIVEGLDEITGVQPGQWSLLGDALGAWIRKGCPRPTGAAETMRRRYHPIAIAGRHLEIYREMLGKSAPRLSQDAPRRIADQNRV